MDLDKWKWSHRIQQSAKLKITRITHVIFLKQKSVHFTHHPFSYLDNSHYDCKTIFWVITVCISEKAFGTVERVSQVPTIDRKDLKNFQMRAHRAICAVKPIMTMCAKKLRIRPSWVARTMAHCFRIQFQNGGCLNLLEIDVCIQNRVKGSVEFS